jgi:quercetin dioxygenase-like cupin family protein
MKPYALNWGEGRTYQPYGPAFAVKAGSYESQGGLVFIEYATRKGEEPGRHTHDGEDEIFYVLSGDVEFSCGDETFVVRDSGFVFLPRNIEHGYKILNEGEARLLVVVAPPRWGESVEAEGEPISESAKAERARRTARQSE